MAERILLAYGFDGQGGATPLVGEAVSQHLQDDKLAWVHMDANHPDTGRWLEWETAYLDGFIIEALLADETRPRMTQVDDGVLLILRGGNLNENAALFHQYPPIHTVGLLNHKILKNHRLMRVSISRSDDAVSNIERGTSAPPPETASAIAHALGCELTDLYDFDWSGRPVPQDVKDFLRSLRGQITTNGRDQATTGLSRHR